MPRAMFSVPVDDFITPAADDAALKIARLFTKYGVRGCFHVVGENARVMRARGRRDVVEALAPHEIGFHSNLHSIAPLPIEDMEVLDWQGGVRRFVQDEIIGARDVAEVFGRWPVYYTHNMAQAPQAVYGARLLGMNAVGAGAMADWRVMRFCGNLLVNWDIGFDPPKKPDDELDAAIERRVEKAMARFEELAADSDRRHPIRLFTHANKYISYENADGVNFVHGAVPPRSQWKLPPLRGKQAAAKLFAQLDELLSRVTEISDVEFVTYDDVIREHGPKPHWAPREAIEALASNFQREFDPAPVDGEPLSAAEQFALLCHAVAGPTDATFVRRIIGPTEEPFDTPSPARIPRDVFVRACRCVDQQIDDLHAVPAAVECGHERFGPGSWMRAMAAAIRDGGSVAIPVTPGAEYPALVNNDFFQKSTVGWRMYPESFTGENICRALRRQSWSAVPL